MIDIHTLPRDVFGRIKLDVETQEPTASIARISQRAKESTMTTTTVEETSSSTDNHLTMTVAATDDVPVAVVVESSQEQQTLPPPQDQQEEVTANSRDMWWCTLLLYPIFAGGCAVLIHAYDKVIGVSVLVSVTFVIVCPILCACYKGGCRGVVTEVIDGGGGFWGGDGEGGGDGGGGCGSGCGGGCGG